MILQLCPLDALSDGPVASKESNYNDVRVIVNDHIVIITVMWWYWFTVEWCLQWYFLTLVSHHTSPQWTSAELICYTKHKTKQTKKKRKERRKRGRKNKTKPGGTRPKQNRLSRQSQYFIIIYFSRLLSRRNKNTLRWIMWESGVEIESGNNSLCSRLATCVHREGSVSSLVDKCTLLDLQAIKTA